MNKKTVVVVGSAGLSKDTSINLIEKLNNLGLNVVHMNKIERKKDVADKELLVLDDNFQNIKNTNYFLQDKNEQFIKKRSRVKKI